MITSRIDFWSSEAPGNRRCTPEPEWMTVKITPDDAINRRLVSWRGMAGEVVQATRHAKVEVSFRAALHLLVLHEQGIRFDGETLIQGMPKSALKDVRRKLTFVPGGHEYRDWHTPRTLFPCNLFLSPSSSVAAPGRIPAQDIVRRSDPSAHSHKDRDFARSHRSRRGLLPRSQQPSPGMLAGAHGSG